jgi:hypothetical protein
MGELTWPGAVQVVVSVYDGTAREVRGFVGPEPWPEVPLMGLPELPGLPPGAQIRDDV